MLLLLVVALTGWWLPLPASALDNGVSKLPPMGWSSWNAMGQDINEQRIKSAADAMVSSGMLAAGYTYINIDDMWAELSRDASGSLVASSHKFPSGMKHLADYIHTKGLKVNCSTSNGAPHHTMPHRIVKHNRQRLSPNPLRSVLSIYNWCCAI